MRLVKVEGKTLTLEHNGKTAEFTVRSGDEPAYEMARVLCGAKKHFTGKAFLSEEEERMGRELLCA